MTFKMAGVRSAIKEPETPERIIGSIYGQQEGPTLVFFGGIHGNEPAGANALELVFRRLQGSHSKLNGNLYGIRGNLQALVQGRRFLDKDLNRIWDPGRPPSYLENITDGQSSEVLEKNALVKLLQTIKSTHGEPFYFVDLHTTSSRTLPFITINDAIINRKFARCFPVPVILGIEEFLEGALLSSLNEEGYLAIGFESGQHEEKEAVANAEAFILLAMFFSGFLGPELLPDRASLMSRLSEAAEGNKSFYEIIYRHKIAPGDRFEMKPGFRSFEPLQKGVLLGEHNGEPLINGKKGILFMPLYQKLGEDGYFVIRHIPNWILAASASLRNIKIAFIFPLLPGVSRDRENPAKLVVDLRWARFFSRRFFHLLGYRHKQLDELHAVFTNREYVARTESYKQAPWFYWAGRLKNRSGLRE
jgi:predicted deacylase